MADPNIPAPHTTSPTLLVVDDDAVMRELLTALLSLEGYIVHAVDSRAAALAFLASASASIILVDIQMSGMSGAAFAAQLDDIRSAGTLLLAMSGSPLPPSEESLYDGFLLKPFEVEDFTAAKITRAIIA
jgi:CheY-like chemotaxis protein